MTDALLYASLAAAAYSVGGELVVVDDVVAFPGSRTARDWLRDLDFELVPCPWGPGRVHRGFLEDLTEAYPGVPRGDHPLVLVGHSMGGSVALLAAQRMLAEDGRKSMVWTFGSPRTGDRAWCDGLRVPHVRYCCGTDPIPHLPPWPWYSHDCHAQHLAGPWWNPVKCHEAGVYLGALCAQEKKETK